MSPAEHVGLLYDPSKHHAHSVVDGDLAVRFVPCEPGESPYEDFGASGRATQFNGAFVVDGPGCVALDVAVGSEAAERTWVSFGAGGWVSGVIPQVMLSVVFAENAATTAGRAMKHLS